MGSFPLRGILKFIVYALGYVAMLGAAVLFLALFVVNPDAEQEKAAYHAVLDYASNKVVALPHGDPDKNMTVKPFESESAQAGQKSWD